MQPSGWNLLLDETSLSSVPLGIFSSDNSHMRKGLYIIATYPHNFQLNQHFINMPFPPPTLRLHTHTYVNHNTSEENNSYRLTAVYYIWQWTRMLCSECPSSHIFLAEILLYPLTMQNMSTNRCYPYSNNNIKVGISVFFN